MNTDRSKALEPCPFCGATDKDFCLQAVQSQDLAGNPKDWSVECSECAAYGPTAQTQNDAIDAWNARTPPTEASERQAALEEAAKFIECNVQVQSSRDDCPYYFGARKPWNTYGLEYAAAIRALIDTTPAKPDTIGSHIGNGGSFDPEAGEVDVEMVQTAFAKALPSTWTDFLDANPDGLTSPEDLPDHALMTGEQFEQWALEALAAAIAAMQGTPKGEQE